MVTSEIYYNPFVKTVLKEDILTEYLFGIFKIRQKKIDTEFPVDLVYLWVDGSDEVWLKKKQKYENKTFDNSEEQACCVGRYADNDELKYSLRSVEKFAPWINRIFIVTDGQVPKWLDTSNPKIKLVFHQDFIPQENLPLFSSTAIETYLAQIPELSEHFIYANDDMFIAEPLDKFFFYDCEKKPIVRLKHQVSKRQAKKSLYNRTILNSQKLIKERYGKNFPYAPHHNIDAYLKSDFLECESVFKNEFETTGKNKFRTEGELQRSIVLYYALAKNRARKKLYSRVDRYFSMSKRFFDNIFSKYSADSIVINANDKNPEVKIQKYKPKLFCINDGEGVTDKDRQRIKIFLEELYPEKSSFELKD